MPTPGLMSLPLKNCVSTLRSLPVNGTPYSDSNEKPPFKRVIPLKEWSSTWAERALSSFSSEPWIPRYFDAGGVEGWFCNLDGSMFFSSSICPDFSQFHFLTQPGLKEDSPPLSRYLQCL